jgi:hypothetical protein
VNIQTQQRPSRAPAPPPETYAQQIEDTSFHEVERSNNVPATRAQPAREVSEAIPERAEPAQAPLPTTPFGNLAGAIAAVMAEIQPVEKAGWNKFHHYAHVRMQDLSRELTPLMGKHGIVVFQTEEGRELFDGGKAVAVRYRFTIVHKSGEIWPERILQTGLSTCRNTKDGFDDKSLNKCHTAARKYFLMSLFQIPSEDYDGDNDNGQGQGEGGNRPRPQGQQGRRPVPSPDGKLPPHLLVVINGEAPQAWAKRFKDFIAKAASEDEVNKWYDLNAVVFGKIKASDVPDVHDELCDAMDARVAQLAGGKSEAAADPISSGKPASLAIRDSDFPGDKRLPVSAIDHGDGSIPWALDRKLSDNDREWLMSLKEAFEQCRQVEEIAAEQESMMLPSQSNVSTYVWNKAVDLVAKNIERING